AYRCGQPFLNEVDATRTDSLDNIANCVTLNRADPRGHALDDPAREARPASPCLAHKLLQHRLRKLRVGNHTILHRTSSLEDFGRTREHFESLVANCDHFT